MDGGAGPVYWAVCVYPEAVGLETRACCYLCMQEDVRDVLILAG